MAIRHQITVGSIEHAGSCAPSLALGKNMHDGRADSFERLCHTGGVGIQRVIGRKW